MDDGAGAELVVGSAEAELEWVSDGEVEGGIEGDGGLDFEVFDGDDAHDGAGALDEFAGGDEDAFDDAIDGCGDVVAGAAGLDECEFEGGFCALLSGEIESERGLVDFELGALELEGGDGALIDGLASSGEFVAGEVEGCLGGTDGEIALGADACELDLGIDLGGVDGGESLARGDMVAGLNEDFGDEAVDHEAEGTILGGADNGVDGEVGGCGRRLSAECRDGEE